MNHMATTRFVLLVVDGLALIGLVVFSVLGARNPDHSGYVIGQIACAVIVLATVLLLRRIGSLPPHDES